MKKSILLLAMFSISLVGCDYDVELEPLNYVTFERDMSAEIGLDSGESATQEITVYASNITNNDRTFDIQVSDATTLEQAGYDVPDSVTVPGGTNEGTFTVGVSNVNLGLAGKELIFFLSETSELSSGDPYEISVFRTCVGTEFVIDLAFDAYASEIEWSLEDSDGNELITVGGYKDGAATASKSLCLDPGTYTFTVTDSFGDGLDPGSITISYAGEELAVIPGDFGDGTSVEVTF